MNKLSHLLFALLLTLCVCLPTLHAQQPNPAANPLQKLQIAEMAIARLYVDKVDEDKLVEEGIRKMLSTLDPHSTYSTPKETKQLTEPLQAGFEGIGVQFQMLDDTMLVIETIVDGPSEKVGILAGDRIITVDGKSIAGQELPNDSILSMLRGRKGTKVNVEVLRRGEQDLLPFTIIRDKIPIYSVDASYMADKGLGYIKISRFAATTYEEFMQAIVKLKKQGMKDLVIDLAGNGGGYLQAVVQMVGELLDKNQVIVYTEGRVQPRMDYNSEGNGTFAKGRIAIIVDDYSASASEIMAGAVQDWDRGIIIGRRTYGKGLVQRPIELPDGSLIRLTTARYYTPAGRCIQKPYNGGDRAQYDQDIADRFTHGELSNADSIHFADSLLCYTRVLKRPVYGGGGIMPDVFVPLDTAFATPLYRKLYARSIVIKWATQYVEQNRSQLESAYKNNFDKFDKDYNLPAEALPRLQALAAEAKIEWDDEQFQASLETIEAQFKALVARNLWGMTEYFRIINRLNKPYLEAIEVMKNGRYEATLGR